MSVRADDRGGAGGRGGAGMEARWTCCRRQHLWLTAAAHDSVMLLPVTSPNLLQPRVRQLTSTWDDDVGGCCDGTKSHLGSKVSPCLEATPASGHCWLAAEHGGQDGDGKAP